jgi:hypothetical protein
VARSWARPSRAGGRSRRLALAPPDGLWHATRSAPTPTV